MSEHRWTPAQKAAIEDEGGSLLVDAAAGSGKTAVLVERAVRMMTREEAPLRADRLLILTFTSAAADELRARLASELEKVLGEQPTSLFLRHQKLLLHRAFIGTIDAFCLQLVREHFSQLGVPPDVSVGQAALLRSLSETALQETLEQMYTDEDFIRFTGLYGHSRSDGEAADAILRLYGYVDTLPWPEHQLDRFSAMYESPSPLSENDWGRELLAYAQQALDAALQLSQAACLLAEEDSALQPWTPALTEDTEALAQMRAVLSAENGWDNTERLLRGFAPARAATVRGYEGETKDHIRLLRGRVKKIVENLRENCFACTEAEYLDDLADAAPMIHALCKAVGLYAQLYREAKLEEKVLDFSDFEHLALRLLMTEDGVRTEDSGQISDRYDMVMVDEYQDTNELQSALYTCLGNPEGRNLFYVGDVKQSIYRFRRANPGLFLEKKAAWAPHESGQHPAVLRLGHNFRSGPAVIEGVNYLFETLMSETLGEVSYGPEERLIQGLPGGNTGGFSFTLVDDPDRQKDAVFVAAKIRQMVQEGVPVREDDEKQRPCNYGDFCVLFRTRGAMANHLAALAAAGIPAVSDLEDDLLNTPEVLPLRAVLAAIDNPGDDVNLAAAMLGPLFHFTPAEITTIRAGSPKGSLYGALVLHPDEKTQRFLQSLSHYRTLSTEMSVGRLCEELVLRCGYLSAVAAMEGGTARRESLHRFIAWAGEMGNSLSGGLSAFVRLLENGRGPKGAGYKGLPGHVSLLTAHKSKGLEFPIVIFADTARGFNLRDRAERIQLHAQLGIGLWLRTGQTLYPTLPILAIRRRGEREALSEEMRVLYVALTRAREYLLITCASKDPARQLADLAVLASLGLQNPYLLSRCHCFGDWLLFALLMHPDAGPLWACIGHPPCVPKNTKSKALLTIEPALALDEEAPAFSLTAAPDNEATQRILTGFSLTLPRSALRQVPRKLSVSALAKGGAPAARRRPSLLYKSGLTAAERGTAMHSFLQMASRAATRQNLTAEIARLVDEGLLGEEQAQALDRPGLAAFFSSPLAHRMDKAERLLLEYDFITAIPAGQLNPTLPEALAGESVYLQGIADAVLVQNGTVEIADYKTDRGKNPDELRETYAGQLHLYAHAVEKRLGLPVRRLTLWSFALGAEIDLPLAPSG